jgi:AcrR family transcriptional regulator
VTKDRILDAAESLFMEHGYEATSLRAITSGAGVNLASVNYHFGSKEELFQAVLTRRLDPMNQERLDLLTRLEGEVGPAPLSCEQILSAMFVPALKARARPGTRRQELPAAARTRVCRSGAIHPQVPGRPIRHDDRTLQVGVREGAPGAAKERALVAPALHHGALSYTLAGTDALRLIAELNPAETGNDEALLHRLAPFLLAGLQSPVPNLAKD